MRIVYQFEKHLKDRPYVTLHFYLSSRVSVVLRHLLYFVVKAVAADVEVPVEFSALVGGEAECFQGAAVEA